MQQQRRRRDGQRIAQLTADVDTDQITALAATQLIQNEFTADKGYDIRIFGEKKAATDAFNDFYNALLITIALIFVMLVALFGTLSEPLLIMMSIPFGLIGVIVGHAIFDYHMQFLSVIGILALCGIIVNDSLILLEFTKKVRATGLSGREAILTAAGKRMRPIILTTVTTFISISPLIFFSTGQTAFLAPMAVSLGFGLVFATVLILLVLPCLYLVRDDIGRISAPLFNKATDARQGERL